MHSTYMLSHLIFIFHIHLLNLQGKLRGLLFSVSFLLHFPNYFLTCVLCIPISKASKVPLHISTAKAKDTGGQLETKGFTTDLYSTKFYTSGISRHLGANPQHSTVTNGQTLEPAGGKGEGEGRTWDQVGLWIKASQGPQPWTGEKVERLQLRCAKINQK